MKKILYSFACLFLLSLPGFAQQICGFDDLMNQAKKNKEIAEAIERTNRQIREIIESNALNPQLNDAGTALYTIPVVVHVVHTGGAIGTMYNPSDAQIISAIDYLNKVYDGTWPSATSGVGDIQVQFKLAQRYGNCNPTNGIDRVDGSVLQGYTLSGIRRYGATGISDLALKNQSRWDPTRYYNIWVVNKIDGYDGTGSSGGVAGYAYFPTGVSPNEDGAVMLSTSMQPGKYVLPHEMGHALGLYHTFQGSTGSTCPVNTDCNTQGDLVCDTDPSTQSFSCRTGVNPCTGFNYNANSENNMMSYTSCAGLFTAGQKARILAAMSLPTRATLANSDADDPLSSGPNPCPPRINFVIPKATVTEATVGTVDCRGYKDYTYSMNIGTAPAATAFATLTTSGLAIDNSDYILTTNGNFSSTSKVVTFPAGSTSNQSFQIRVFDDAAVEVEESLIIDFTVDANGGNAEKGDGIPTFSLSIISNDNDFPDPSTGQNVETLVNATGTAYFGPHDDVYFYSASGNMLVRLKNFSDFDYGCTQVKIDRAGAGAKAFTSNTAAEFVADKTVQVTPTFDKPNGSFEITLYFKATEVNGWASATGKTIFDAKLVKTPNAISSYTAGSVPQGVVKVANTANGYYGSDNSINGTFNGALKGGFGMGAPSISAPVVYTFNGNGLWTDAANWANNAIPPPVLPAGAQIIIDPMPDGQCILNTSQTVQQGGSISVNAYKNFIIQGKLDMVN